VSKLILRTLNASTRVPSHAISRLQLQHSSNPRLDERRKHRAFWSPRNRGFTVCCYLRGNCTKILVHRKMCSHASMKLLSGWDFTFSRWWIFKSWSSGLWRRVVMWVKMEAAWTTSQRRRHRHVTNSMEQIPSGEANSDSASRETSRLLWNPKVHYRVHRSPPLVFILSQMLPVHTFPPNYLKIRSNTILPSAPRSSEWSLAGFPAKILYALYISPCVLHSRPSRPWFRNIT